MNWDKNRSARILGLINGAGSSPQQIESLLQAMTLDLETKLKIDPRTLTAVLKGLLDSRQQTPKKSFSKIEDVAKILQDLLQKALSGQPKPPPIAAIQALVIDLLCSLAPPTRDFPVLLLPVRLETRLKGRELCVRIYPDDIAINSHDPTLSEAE